MRRIATARLSLNMRTEGSGPPLLFLGGSNFDMSLRAPVFDSALTDHFTVSAADPRGLGLSDAPDGAWTMEDYAQDALSLLDALGWETATLLGESFGGMTALHLAALAPHRITRMAVSVTAAGGTGGQSYPIHEFQDLPDPADRARAAMTLQDRRFADLAPAEAEARVTARVAQDARFQGHANNATGYPKLLAARAGHDAYAKLDQIPCPTLILAGLYDDQAPLERARVLAQALPKAELMTFEAGHSLLFTDPAAVPAVLAHLKEETT